jgi:hypothetical protein
MEHNCKRMVQVANVMQIPMVATEELPDKFGTTTDIHLTQKMHIYS